MTWLELFDTIAKVGLGGLISALTTYAVTERTHSNQAKTALRAERVSLVKEAIVKVEAATSLINEIRQAVFTAKAAGPDRDAKFYAAAEGLIAAYNLTKDARAYLALAGQKRDCPGRC